MDVLRPTSATGSRFMTVSVRPGLLLPSFTGAEDKIEGPLGVDHVLLNRLRVLRVIGVRAVIRVPLGHRLSEERINHGPPQSRIADVLDVLARQLARIDVAESSLCRHDWAPPQDGFSPS